MGEVTERIAKHLMWMVIAGLSVTGCTPARYAYLNKVKSSPQREIARVKVQEPLVVINVPDTSVGQDVIAGTEISGPEEEGLVASNEKNTAVSLKKNNAIHHVLKSAKTVRAAKTTSLAGKAKAVKGMKALTSFKKPVKADDYDAGTHRGLLWSLVAAVLLVWLVGVLFTNVGGLVHILLAVALILVVLNLLS